MITTLLQSLRAFDRAMSDNPRAPYVTRYSALKIIANRMVPVIIGETGCLVWDHHDGRIECAGLFSAGPKGAGLALLGSVIETYGVNYVECFEPLNRLYGTLGFETVKVSEWNSDYAPKNWLPSFGTPNYHEMMLA